MKCPKCQYITFDQGDRCRNCGYEFSLSADLTELDLPIKTGDEALGPLADFSLADIDDTPLAEQVLQQEETRPVWTSTRRERSATELPLFRDRVSDDDAPLVSLPASPRAPVAVRKSTAPRGGQQRAAFDEPGLDLEPAAPPALRPVDSRPQIRGGDDVPASASRIAPAGARLFAAAIDLLLLSSIDAAVLYLTLRLCGLEFDEVGRIPVAPFAVFVAVLNGGYLATFTAAGGQTIGKMATGIKVVTMDDSAESDRVPLGQAVLRAAAYLVSVLPVGLGVLPILLGAERRGVHDRLAHTRVVKA